MQKTGTKQQFSALAILPGLLHGHLQRSEKVTTSLKMNQSHSIHDVLTNT